MSFSFRIGVLIFLLILLFVAMGWSMSIRNEFEFAQDAGNPLAVPEARPPVIVPPPVPPTSRPDIEPQLPLENPPSVIKAIYATNWSAGSEKKLSYLISLIRDTELNAIVIDIKDYTGYIGYNTKLELPKKYKAVELRIPRLNELIKRLHDEGIYVIGRVSVFQDQRLALARPELALQSSSTQSVWRDRKGLTWLDTASTEVWDYHVMIAQELKERGIDEINFDYIRFASDGNLSDIVYPVWNGTTLKTHIIQDFFKYLREKLPDATLSADLFGLVTVNTDGLGIGQKLEYAIPHFDAIAPMVYPSHYYKGSFGYEAPAAHPYEIVKQSMENAVKRLRVSSNNASTTPSVHISTLRPWLQDFDLGADYDAVKVRAQIQAVYDALCTREFLALHRAATTSALVHCEESEADTAYYNGWMLWNPSNVYTREALLKE